MSDREPTQVTNLDRYGFPALLWSRARDALTAGTPSPNATFFLGTVGPDGKPHAPGVGGLWQESDLNFTSGPGMRKARDLAADPACTISVRLEGIDLVLEGSAARVTDGPTLELVAGKYREGGWPARGGRRRVHGPVQRAERSFQAEWRLHRSMRPASRSGAMAAMSIAGSFAVDASATLS